MEEKYNWLKELCSDSNNVDLYIQDIELKNKFFDVINQFNNRDDYDLYFDYSAPDIIDSKGYTGKKGEYRLQVGVSYKYLKIIIDEYRSTNKYSFGFEYHCYGDNSEFIKKVEKFIKDGNDLLNGNRAKKRDKKLKKTIKRNERSFKRYNRIQKYIPYLYHNVSGILPYFNFIAMIKQKWQDPKNEYDKERRKEMVASVMKNIDASIYNSYNPHEWYKKRKEKNENEIRNARIFWYEKFIVKIPKIIGYVISAIIGGLISKFF